MKNLNNIEQNPLFNHNNDNNYDNYDNNNSNVDDNIESHHVENNMNKVKTFSQVTNKNYRNYLTKINDNINKNLDTQFF